MKLSKRTVLWIIPVLLIVAFYYFYGPKDEIVEHEYIDYVKAVSLVENNNTSVEQALQNYCNEAEWVFFEAQKGQKVVEFKGQCDYDNSSQPINWQFIVEDEKDSYKMGALLINQVKQEQPEKDRFIETLYQ